nr:poly-gamma-glutamate system protein [Alsobacter ponti]
MAALASVLVWQAVERLGATRLHPRAYEMLAAAQTLQAASRIIAAEKTARGLMQPESVDPNRTGLIGPEYTPITTTVGELPAKRSVANPDFAAALVRLIDSVGLPRGAPVVVILSGSFVGADIAAVAAVEALGLRPVLVVSLSASMFGATDPDFNILDMLGLLRRRGVLQTRPELAVLGGEMGVASGMEPEAVALLRLSAFREGAKLVSEPTLAGLVDRLVEQTQAALGPGVRPGLVINVGGALVALGNCPQSYEMPPGLSRRPLACGQGTPGLALRLAGDGRAPILHVINIRRMALELGLPFDPVPLPRPGLNPAVYGTTATTNEKIRQGDMK